MHPVRVKICGVKSLEEAEIALELGADALGFNFWPRSPRHIEPRAAGQITRRLPAFTSCVGVFVNEELDGIRRVIEASGIDAIQLHGDETPEFCGNLEGIRLIKAMRVTDGFDPSELGRFPVNAVLLDSDARSSYGGTGRTFDWTLAIEARRYARIILAGGLNADNVADAIKSVRPYAVDVCSGVEAEPGQKDLGKLRAFLSVATRANRECEV